VDGGCAAPGNVPANHVVSLRKANRVKAILEVRILGNLGSKDVDRLVHVQKVSIGRVFRLGVPGGDTHHVDTLQ